MCGNAGPVTQRVFRSSRFKGTQAQGTTVANATGFALLSVTRPGQLQGRTQLQPAADDLTLAECDERRGDSDVRCFCAHLDELVERVVVLGAAVGVAGAILCDGADVDLFRSQHLGPADGSRKKMRIAEWDVGYGNLFADVGRFGDSDVLVRKRGAADLSEAAVLDEHARGDAEAVADPGERFALAGFRALAVTDVHGCNVRGAVFARGDGGADSRVHASAEEHHGADAGLFGHVRYLGSDALGPGFAAFRGLFTTEARSARRILYLSGNATFLPLECCANAPPLMPRPAPRTRTPRFGAG